MSRKSICPETNLVVNKERKSVVKYPSSDHLCVTVTFRLIVLWPYIPGCYV